MAITRGLYRKLSPTRAKARLKAQRGGVVRARRVAGGPLPVPEPAPGGYARMSW
jgi:hypothetical protein